MEKYNITGQDCPDHEVVKNEPYNTWNVGSVPGWGTKIPHAEQLSPSITTRESMYCSEDPMCCNQDPTQPNK